MKTKRLLSGFILRITAALGLLLFTFVSAGAVEIKYPVPGYEGQELEKVREWEKTWAGKRITSANIEGVKEFLPEHLYNILKDPGQWGESWFEIVPYKTYTPTTAEIKFTKAGKCTIGPDENLLNYVSGIPFPNPKTPLEMIYNFDHLNRGDATYDFVTGPIVDGRRKYDRKLEVDQDVMYFTARRETPPVPAFPDNDKDIYWAYHVVYHFPVQLKGMRAMTITWNERSRDYGSWEFSQTNRRVIRRSTKQRQRHISISDLTYNDQSIWNWTVPANTYKLLGQKELLVARHNEDPTIISGNHTEGELLPNGVKKERMNLYVLDVKSKDPDYLYSREVWYLDPESWVLFYADKYDKQGRLWKVMEVYSKEVKSLQSGENIHVQAGQFALDVQRKHSSLLLFYNTELGKTGPRFVPSYYTPKALLKYGY